MKHLLVATLAVALAAACGDTSSSPAPPAPPAPYVTPRYVGKWNYQSGSAIVADCAGAPEQTVDLSMAPPANQPGWFVFSVGDAGALHEVDARGCQYDWALGADGGSAAAVAGQSCATFPDGRGGNRLVHLQSGTKSTGDGASMTVDVHFTTDAPSGCAIHVQGTATKS